MSRHYRNHIILFTKNSIWIIDSAKMYVLNHMGHFGDIRKEKKEGVARCDTLQVIYNL